MRIEQRYMCFGDVDATQSKHRWLKIRPLDNPGQSSGQGGNNSMAGRRMMGIFCELDLYILHKRSFG
ncbi:uncharacterized protein PHALS_02598 [Plasmopara halstedii]|uniref:Uncharacterized protein n=1 Tax=Plasmopara halstedii TaxID=4781 RepID=A0A0P1AUV3_PLAHL|nr:uncharacterized protein PHALS_02598 [Plasmopara halstedii]CEG46183.1 hypothetical protein PHALS_02598 [Plasmopara halstedii]|eukprot:XP_024582552.1 hypothetical protein PHALS_02598 [Plasmopara halstedii]